MLTKHNMIDIPSDNPFANDKLNRKVIVDNLTRLVESTNQPFVISIESPWGTGKTTFIQMWKKHLDSLGHTCLYFNAWENDFVEDPLIAFIGEMGKAFTDKKEKGKISKQFKKIQKIGGKVVRRILPVAIQVATQGLLSQSDVEKTSAFIATSSDELATFTSGLAEEKIKQYEKDKNGIIEFKKELEKLAKSLSENEGNKSPMIFFIDELDRCRPDFSLALLERIKHIFSVEGVVFVLGVDRSQLEESIKSLYGQKINTDGYLRRFIDYVYKLPKADSKSFIYYLSIKFNLDEVFKIHGNYNEQTNLLETFIKLASIFNLSLRAQEQSFTEINLVYRTTPRNYIISPVCLAFILALKAYDKNLFEELYLTAVDINKFLDIFLNTKEGQAFLESNSGIDIEASLINDYLLPLQREERIKELNEIANGQNQHAGKRAKRVLEWLDYSRGAIKNLLSRLDVTRDFDK